MGRKDPNARWERRGFAAAALELVAMFGPGIMGVVVAIAIPSIVRPDGVLEVVAVWVASIAAGVGVAVLADRQLRRLLPLVVLLRLSLEFPDRAPSRFKVALRAGTLRNLPERLAHVADCGVDGDPSVAAAQMLELLSSLTRYDRRTRGHSERVRAFADLIATEMRLAPIDRDRLRWSALLHDIGKLHVDVAILNKPGKLDGGEWDAVRAHPHVGARIAAPLLPWLGEWGTAIEHHHERWDGSGYPVGLAGADIALGARIVAVADAFEVMTAARSYKEPMSVAAAREELLRCAGCQFDPEVVRALFAVSMTRLRWVIGPAAFVALVPGIRRAWALKGALSERPAVRAGFAALFAALAIPATEGSTANEAVPGDSPAASADPRSGASVDADRPWAIVRGLYIERGTATVTSSSTADAHVVAPSDASMVMEAPAAIVPNAPAPASDAAPLAQAPETTHPPSGAAHEAGGSEAPAQPARRGGSRAGRQQTSVTPPGEVISSVARSGSGPGHGQQVSTTAHDVEKPADRR